MGGRRDGRAGDEAAAGAGGNGRLRASHADREQAIDTLKIAFVHGRLTQDEFEARIGQVHASRTYAELTALARTSPAHDYCCGPVAGADDPHGAAHCPDAALDKCCASAHRRYGYNVGYSTVYRRLWNCFYLRWEEMGCDSGKEAMFCVWRR